MFSSMKTCKFNARLAVLPCILTALSTQITMAIAQSSTPAPILKEVVVSASRVAVPVTDVIADVSVIDRVILDQAGQSTLRDILGQLPGVQFVSNGGYRSSTKMFLRGATSAQTIVMIDGIRVGSATSGEASYENMPLDRIERIEVLRGAASALYGPDAVGGVVQIFTRDPVDGLQLTANAGAGSDGQKKAAASLRGRTGAVGYSLGVSKEKATGISVATNPAATSYNPDDDSFDISSLDAKLTAQIAPEHALTLGVLRSKMAYQFDGTVTPNPLVLTKLTTDAKTQPTLTQINLKWEGQWLPNWKSTVQLGSSADEATYTYVRIADGALNGRTFFNTQRTQASWQNDISIGTDVLGLLLENRSESVDSSTLYAVKEREVRSALASYALNRDSWNALAVMRNDNNSQFGSFNNWALSGGYKLNPQWRAVTSMGTSFQSPTFNQLYYPGSGDVTLTPQRNFSREIGLKYQQGADAATAVVYQNDIDGFIATRTNKQSKTAVLRGATLSYQAQRDDLSYRLGYDYADPKTLDDGLRFVRVARHVWNLNVTQRIGQASVYSELKLSSDRQDNSVITSNKVRANLPGYALINVGANWKLQKDLTLQARVNNLADKQYVLADGYSTLGRNVFVSLSWAN
jgi:vitamin B12 transporter